MKRIACLIIVLSALPVIAAEPKQPAPDTAAVQGNWTVESAEGEGQAAKSPVGDTVTITQDTVKIKEKSSGQTHEFRIKADASQNPKQVDWVLTSGEKTVTVQGIYTLEKDSLKVCLARPGKPRPTEFSTKENDGRRLIVLKRAK
jgi:uncharacterized protein (TIGR03067 family)